MTLGSIQINLYNQLLSRVSGSSKIPQLALIVKTTQNPLEFRYKDET